MRTCGTSGVSEAIRLILSSGNVTSLFQRMIMVAMTMSGYCMVICTAHTPHPTMPYSD